MDQDDIDIAIFAQLEGTTGSDSDDLNPAFRHLLKGRKKDIKQAGIFGRGRRGKTQPTRIGKPRHRQEEGQQQGEADQCFHALLLKEDYRNGENSLQKPSRSR